MSDEDRPGVLWWDFYGPDWGACGTCGHYSQATLDYYPDGSVEWREELSCASWERFEGSPEGFFEWFDQTYRDFPDPELTGMVSRFKEWLNGGDSD